MQDLYRRVFEAVPAYCTVQDRQLRIIEANPRFRDDFGEPDNDYCYRLYKGRREPCPSCPVVDTFADGRPRRTEEEVLCQDGRRLQVLVQTCPLYDEQGRLVAVLETSTDITDQKRLQQQAEREHQRYRLLFEQVPCYISIQDAELNVLEANRRFRDDFGEFAGRKCYQVYKHRSEPCLECVVQQAFADGAIHHTEEVVSSRSGRKNVLVAAAPLRGAGDTIEAVMEMSADITSIRQLQGKLESIGLLISSISHGIKGLLTGLDGGRYLVNSGMARDEPERVRRGWAMVERNVERIRSTVLNILYYAKDRTPQLEQLDVSELVDEVTELMRAKAEQLGVEFNAELAGRPQLVADRAALRALLVNLLENSFDACRVDNRKSAHRVGLTARSSGGEVHFVIADNGIGMDTETRDKAFSLFYSSKGTEGTGLGLFIADKIARAHGGGIEIASQPGAGTTFTVRLPSQGPQRPEEET